MSKRKVAVAVGVETPNPNPAGASAATVELVQALTEAWHAIMKRHPEVPDVVVLPAPALRPNTLGHFWAMRWQPPGAGGTPHHEVIVCGEGLNRTPRQVFGTLLHEAAHALNFARGVKDCSASQYHNAKFAHAAEELGLSVKKVANYGFAVTRVLDETANLYAPHIDRIGKAVLVRRGLVPLPPPGPDDDDDEEGGDERGTKRTKTDAEPKGRMLKTMCQCEPANIIRMSRKVLEAASPITCGACGEPFTLAD
jgi:hypothetical protein